MSRAHYLGIDLGTTNSTACLFDGEQLSVVRTSGGDVLTPSVVRIDKKENATVGIRARKFLQRDPENTRGEFKRLMGTENTISFPAAGISRRPEELAALVLQSLRKDVEAQSGLVPEQAVIAVPALFELPQIRATGEAARLAGFRHIETIQEPVASALAAGWSAEESSGSWLVYDLGGGTFDVSILDSREGLLRVVGHDGDNFLGGRDFDVALALVLAKKLEEELGVAIDRSNPAHATAFSKLKSAAEEAKIELSRAEEVEVILDGFEIDGEAVELFECSVSVEELEAATLPLIDRSIRVCQRALDQYGTRQLERLVLVGGPTVMPILRKRLQEKLEVPFEAGLDPMTLVARGAALLAATSGLEVAQKTQQVQSKGPKLWMQFPKMTPDLSPFVVGRSATESEQISAVRFEGADGHDFDSDWTPVEADGTFCASVLLKRRAVATFNVTARLADGSVLAASPPQIAITHGVSIGDPPLSRGIGVARADNSVAQYFERGTPLPCRKSFTLRTIERIDPRSGDYALRVPIVQGDFPFAHVCRLVGVIQIRAEELKSELPANSVIELTIEVDRGGALSARAIVPAQELVFEHVESLIAPEVSIDHMEGLWADQTKRGSDLRRAAFQMRDPSLVSLLGDFEALQGELRVDIAAARGGDRDAAEKARRALIDADGLLADAEARMAWPELSQEITELHVDAAYWVEAFGTQTEKNSLRVTAQGIERALRAKNVKDVERLMRTLRSLRGACSLRAPGAWSEQLDYFSSIVEEATDPKAAQKCVARARQAETKGNQSELERAVRDLWKYFPASAEDRALSFDSGVK